MFIRKPSKDCSAPVKQLSDIALLNKSSHRYGASLDIWDHTVLPATRHKWTHRAVLDLPTPEGWKAELIQAVAAARGTSAPNSIIPFVSHIRKQLRWCNISSVSWYVWEFQTITCNASCINISPCFCNVAQYYCANNWLKLKGPGSYIPPLTGKPEQQRFTIWSGRTDQH